MKSKRILQIIAVVEALIICFFVFSVMKEQKHDRELFINHTYFFLKDASDYLAKGQFSYAIAPLLKLDELCRVTQLESGGKYHYSTPFLFDKLANSIITGDASEEELKTVAEKIKKLVSDLSDNTGYTENSSLTYDDLNNLFDSFYASLE